MFCVLILFILLFLIEFLELQHNAKPSFMKILLFRRSSSFLPTTNYLEWRKKIHKSNEKEKYLT